MIPMLLMMLGEVVFGGVGCGLYGMIGFVIFTVFIAGLMVGRTPEYLGKKISPYEMRMAVLVCLATPVAVLLGSAAAALLPGTVDSLNQSGPHGLSEILYAYASTGGNNGSAFAGFDANTKYINVSTSLTMLFARFVPMVATLAIAGSMLKKRKVAVSAGTLPTHDATFIFLLILIVLIVGALSFFPALALGPVAEFLQTAV
jgi:K+-transporting ATPase ATPase A chain